MTIVADQFDEGYPAWSWSFDFEQQCELRDGATLIASLGSGTLEADGYGVVSDLPHKRLGDALATASANVSSATATLFTSGTYTDGVVVRSVGAVPVVRLSLTLASSTTNVVKLQFSTEAQALSLGYDGDGGTPASIVGAPRTLGGATVFDFCTDYNWGGYFAPRAYNRRLEYNDGNRAVRVRSEYDPTAFTTVDRGTYDTRLAILRDVHERYLTASHAADSILADVASTNTEDTYNTLDRLIDADIDEKTITLVMNSSASQAVSLEWSKDPGTETFASPGAAGRRFWTIRIPMVDQ